MRTAHHILLIVYLLCALVVVYLGNIDACAAFIGLAILQKLELVSA